MRLFIAIDSPQKFKEDLEQLVNPLAKQFPAVSWTKKENIHLTLKFLGFVGDKKLLPKIKDSVLKSIGEVNKFKLEFERVGYFEREQLIIWVGLKTSDQLRKLADNLDKDMKRIGFPAEKRLYTPHITIGRGKHLLSDENSLLKEKLRENKFDLPGLFEVNQISLVESTLTPKGPIYTPVFKFALR